MNFNWSIAQASLQEFGGEKITLRVPKTGLPFYDALKLYGAIELFIGLREDVSIVDNGDKWSVTGRSRIKTGDRSLSALNSLRKNKPKGKDKAFIENFNRSILTDEYLDVKEVIDNGSPLQNPDSALKDGVRGIAASQYKGLESGYGFSAKLPLSHAIMAFAGQKRIHEVSGIFFLPVFEGKIDLGKVVSPVRVWSSVPNPFLIKTLELLTLMTSLFSDNYEGRLSAVVYNTNYGYKSKIKHNYSGLISISSTALKNVSKEGGMGSETVSRLFSVYKSLLSKAYENNKYTNYFLPAYSMAQWVLNPVPKHLSSFITSQEMLFKDKGYYSPVFTSQSNKDQNQNNIITKDIFTMTYSKYEIQTEDHEAVRKLARAVASAIYYARQRPAQNKGEDPGKVWYDEVVMLRSAPSTKVFNERALTLLEQGHKENSFVGTRHNEEDYDPSTLLKFMGDTNRHSFEVFRDLFRMYLIQESTRKKTKGPTTQDAEANVETNRSEDNE